MLRVKNAFAMLMRFKKGLPKEETLDFYSQLFSKKVTDLEKDVLQYAR